MINSEGQRILRHLNGVYEDDRLESSALFIPRTHTSPASLQSIAKGRPPGVALVAEVDCDDQEVLELIDRGYIVRGSGAWVRISEDGRRLVARDFADLPPAAATSQTITISGGAIGNMAVSTQGPASISGSPVTQNIGDVRDAIAQLLAVIDRSDLPAATKADAKLEVGQVGLELEKSTKDPDRIKGYLDSIRDMVAGSAQVVGPLAKLVEALNSSGLI